jgi:hypothetical protein
MRYNPAWREQEKYTLGNSKKGSPKEPTIKSTLFHLGLWLAVAFTALQALRWFDQPVEGGQAQGSKAKCTQPAQAGEGTTAQAQQAC